MTREKLKLLGLIHSSRENLEETEDIYLEKLKRGSDLPGIPFPFDEITTPYLPQTPTQQTANQQFILLQKLTLRQSLIKCNNSN